jgi:DNA-binding transcriptional MerR regulator/methylmalonyl-CoA mutase cobalamin-binding subunit
VRGGGVDHGDGITMAAMTDDGHLMYPVQAAARLTGLSTDTLRAWERRYGAVVPRRVGRGRGYSPDDITRLHLLRTAVQRGHAIGQIARLSNDALESLLSAPRAERSAAPAAPAAHALTEPLLEALRAYDSIAIEREFSRLAAVMPPSDLILSVVVPVLQVVGDAWQRGTLSPGQEHLLSGVIRHVLGSLLRVLAPGTGSPRVLFATPSGERHDLGALSAAVLAAAAGVGVVYLGADLPATEIAEAAKRTGVDMVVVAVTAMPEAKARAYVQDLRRRLPPAVPLWLGGPSAPRVSSTRRTAGLEHFSSELSSFLAERARRPAPTEAAAP